MSCSRVTSAVTKVTGPLKGDAGSWRAHATTAAPSRTSRSTIAAPMPVLPPVTSAVRPAKRSAIRRHEDLPLRRGREQRAERALHPVERDMAADERARVDLSTGKERGGGYELVAPVVDREAEVDLLDERGDRHDLVGFGTPARDDDPAVHSGGVDRGLDHPGGADALEDDVEAGRGRTLARV